MEVQKFGRPLKKVTCGGLRHICTLIAPGHNTGWHDLPWFGLWSSIHCQVWLYFVISSVIFFVIIFSF